MKTRAFSGRYQAGSVTGHESTHSLAIQSGIKFSPEASSAVHGYQVPPFSGRVWILGLEILAITGVLSLGVRLSSRKDWQKIWANRAKYHPLYAPQIEIYPIREGVMKNLLERLSGQADQDFLMRRDDLTPLVSDKKADPGPCMNVDPYENFFKTDSEEDAQPKFPCAQTCLYPDLLPSSSAGHILLVDDDPIHIELISEFLAIENYKVQSARDGEEALAILKAGHKPDLILLDIVMPRKNGFEICRDIRSWYSPVELPVIILTVRQQTSDLVKGFECGANDYLTKPVSYRELIVRVNTHIHLLKSNRALKRTEKRYRELFENTFDFWFTHDLQGKMLETNLHLKKGWGYEEADIRDMNIKDFILEENKDQFKEYLENVLSAGRGDGVASCKTRTGQPRFLDYRVSPVLDETGQAVAVRGVAQDVSEQIQLKRDKADLEKQIRQSQKMQAIGTLAGGIAHDFNNILFPIMGYTEMAMSNVPDNCPAQNYMKEVFKAATRATELVQQILTFSRQSEEEWKPLKVAPVIKEVLKLIDASLPSTIKIRTDIPDHSGYIMGDPTQIHQVMMNLCTNAYHAMREQGGTLDVTLRDMEFSPQDVLPIHDLKPGMYYVLTIRDTGHGMPPDILERIFEPYFTTKDVGEGTGMGLAIVHRIVKNLGGYISAESSPGAGATFAIFLPRLEPKIQDPLPIPEKDLPRGTESILVVDDEQQIVNMLEQMLSDLGYQVTARYSSLDALAAFQANPGRYDLIITDQIMPNMTGISLCRRLMEIRRDIRVILCTGFSALVTEKDVAEAGIHGYLLKPVIKSRLALTIREILDR
jgi:PAS domain S-box-containing protein